MAAHIEKLPADIKVCFYPGKKALCAIKDFLSHLFENFKCHHWTFSHVDQPPASKPVSCYPQPRGSKCKVQTFGYERLNIENTWRSSIRKRVYCLFLDTHNCDWAFNFFWKTEEEVRLGRSTLMAISKNNLLRKLEIKKKVFAKKVANQTEIVIWACYIRAVITHLKQKNYIFFADTGLESQERQRTIFEYLQMQMWLKKRLDHFFLSVQRFNILFM